MEEQPLDPELLAQLLRIEESLRQGGERLAAGTGGEAAPEADLRSVERALFWLESELPREGRGQPSWKPARVGRFEVEHVLGSGGFSIVYAAVDPTLNRRVAIKIPRPHSLIDGDLRERFVTEAQAAARLDHPHIVPVFEAGHAGEIPYLVTQLCEGPDLERWLHERGSPLPPRLAASVVRQLATAVEYSHSRGILHRDIKPGNVLLFPDPDSGWEEFPYHPRLADFGLAKFLGPDRPASASSQLLGTVAYLGPERIRDSAQSATPLSDVYALGAMLYTLLLGQPPFHSASTAETLRQIAEQEPVAPRTVDRSIPAELSWICLKCLEKDPPRRYARAGDLADDLERYLAGRPIRARSTSPWVRGLRWSRRQPLLALASATALLLLLALMTGWALHTRSLTGLRNQLRQRNTELLSKVEQLDVTLAAESRSRREADQQRRLAEELGLIQDLSLAGAAYQAGDPAGAGRLLDHAARALTASDPAGKPAAGFFVFRHLQARLARQPHQSVTCGQIPWDAQLSPDGRELAVCGSRGWLQIWTVPGLEMARETRLSETELNFCTWIGDGAALACGGDAGEVLICDAGSLAITHRVAVTAPASANRGVDLGDGRLLVCGQRGSLAWCQLATGEVGPEIPTPHERGIETLVVSDDRRLVLSGGTDGQLCCWELPTFRLVWQQRLGPPAGTVVEWLRFTPDGREVLVTGPVGEVRRLSVADGSERGRWQGLDRLHAGFVTRDWSLVGDDAGVISLLSLRDPRAELVSVDRWLAHEDRLSLLVWLGETPGEPGRLQFVSGDRRGMLKLWSQELSPFELRVAPPSDPGRIVPDSVAWTPAGELLRTTGAGLQVLDRSGRELRRDWPEESLLTVAWTDRGAVVGTADGRILVAGGASHDVLGSRPVVELGADRAGDYVVARSPDDEVCVIRVVEGTEVWRRTRRAAQAISPDGRWLASARTSPSQIEIYALGGAPLATPVQVLLTHRNTICDLEFTPDSERLISQGHDRRIGIWRVRDWAREQLVSCPPTERGHLAIHPDGRTVAVTDNRQTVRFLDMGVGRESLRLFDAVGPVNSLSFSPDGRVLAIVDGAGAVRLLEPPDPPSATSR